DPVGDKPERGVTEDPTDAPHHDRMRDKRYGRGGREALLLADAAQDERQPADGGPDRQQRAEPEQEADQRVVAVLPVDKLDRDKPHELAIVIADRTTGGDRLAALPDGAEPARLHHPATDDHQQDRRQDPGKKHGAPTARTALDDLAGRQ